MRPRKSASLGACPDDLGVVAASYSDNFMFWAIFVILLILWALGLICHVAFSNLLLVIAVIVLVIRLVRSRSP
jgi:Family of unknown function (DUF5670)